MSIKGIKFCDLCGETICLDDLAPITIEKDGHLQRLHFHNRHSDDCLAQELSLLETELTPA
ncbi:MAG TPA: hypothetical protein VME23_15370 [Terracidiphilus sp.]|nr:hypothetical protein [Terracidiphilus sp.]